MTDKAEPTLRIMIADDHAVMRMGLRKLLEDLMDVQIHAEACDGQQAVELALEHKPDMIIMDLGLPRLHGSEATRQIVQDDPDIGVVALSTYCDSRTIKEFFSAGGRAYVAKECLFDEVIQAIEAVRDGRMYITPKVSDALVPQVLGDESDQRSDSVFSVLTPRERQTLQLLAEGLTMKQIAARLQLSYKTVHTFRRRLTEKLGLYTDAALTKYAIRERLTTPDADFS